MRRVYIKTIVSLCLGCIQSVSLLGSAWLLTTVVDIVTGRNTNLDLRIFGTIAVLFFLFYILIYWVSQKSYIGVKADLRTSKKTKLFTGLLWVSEKEHYSRKPGDISAKFQQQIDTWESDYLEPLYAIIKDVVLLIFSFFIVAQWNWLIAVGTIGVFLFYLILTKGISKKCEYLLNMSIKATADESNELIVMVQSFHLAREQNAEDYFTSRYSIKAREASEASCCCNMMYNILTMLNGNLNAILSLIVIVIGSIMLINDVKGVSVGGILGYSQLVTTLVWPIGNMGTNIAKIRGTKSLRNGFFAFEKLGKMEKQHWSEGGDELRKLDRITFSNVNFTYGAEKVLDGVSFSLFAGKNMQFLEKVEAERLLC